MTEKEQERIELFRRILQADVTESDDAEAYLSDFNHLFPEPKPKDPVEECRKALMQYFIEEYYSSSKPLVDIMDIYNKWHPEDSK